MSSSVGLGFDKRLSSESASLCVGLGDAFQFPKEDLASAVRTL